MGMGIGINAEQPDEGALNGHQEPVACYVWFTSSGAVMPKRLKYRDQQGVIREIRGIHVQSHKETNYCGIPAVRYECDCVMWERKYEFSLIFYLERHEWKLIWK